MGAVIQSQDSQARAGVGHVVGVGIGFALAAAVVGLTSWEGRLRMQSVQEAAVAPLWVLIGLYFLAGAIAAVVLLLRPTPWVPTVAAATLLYYLLVSMPGGWGAELPYPDGVPRLQWSFTAVGLMVGLLSATALWSWWSYLRRPDHD